MSKAAKVKAQRDAEREEEKRKKKLDQAFHKAMKWLEPAETEDGDPDLETPGHSLSEWRAFFDEWPSMRLHLCESCCHHSPLLLHQLLEAPPNILTPELVDLFLEKDGDKQLTSRGNGSYVPVSVLTLNPHGRPAGLFEKFITRQPAMALEKDGVDGEGTCIHNLCKNATYPITQSELQFIIRTPQAKEALSVQDWNERTPLHWYCNNVAPTKKFSLPILRALLAAEPEAAKIEDYRRCVPVMLLLRKGRDEQGVAELLDAYPDALTCTSTFNNDYTDSTLLHCAARNKRPCLATMQLLMKRRPQMAGQKDGEGRFPLQHLSANEAHSMEQLALLLTAHPAARNLPDHDDNIPSQKLLLAPSEAHRRLEEPGEKRPSTPEVQEHKPDSPAAEAIRVAAVRLVRKEDEDEVARTPEKKRAAAQKKLDELRQADVSGSGGRMLLHLYVATALHRSTAVLEAFLDVAPGKSIPPMSLKLLRKKCEDKHAPPFLLLCEGNGVMRPTLAELEWFTRVFPESWSQRDSDGRCMLARLCTSEEHPQAAAVFALALQHTPKEVALAKDIFDYTPLHLVADRAPLVTSMHIPLLRRYPELCTVTCDGGWTALHMAGRLPPALFQQVSPLYPANMHALRVSSTKKTPAEVHADTCRERGWASGAAAPALAATPSSAEAAAPAARKGVVLSIGVKSSGGASATTTAAAAAAAASSSGASTEKELAAVTKERNELIRRAERLEQELGAARSDNARLEAASKTAHQSAERLRTELEQKLAAARVASAAAQVNADLESKYNAEREAHARALERISNLQAGFTDGERRAQLADAARAEVESKLKEKSETLEWYRGQVESAQQAAKTAEARVSQLEKQLEATADKHKQAVAAAVTAAASGASSSSAQELEKLRTLLSIAQSEQQVEATAAAARLASVQQSHQQASAELARVQASLTAATTGAASSASASATRIQQLEQDMASLRKEASSWVAKEQQLLADKEDLSARLEAALHAAATAAAGAAASVVAASAVSVPSPSDSAEMSAAAAAAAAAAATAALRAAEARSAQQSDEMARLQEQLRDLQRMADERQAELTRLQHALAAEKAAVEKAATDAASAAVVAASAAAVAVAAPLSSSPPVHSEELERAHARAKELQSEVEQLHARLATVNPQARSAKVAPSDGSAAQQAAPDAGSKKEGGGCVIC